MNLQHKCSNTTVKQMDMERAAINWGLTMSQAKVKQQCGLLLFLFTLSGICGHVAFYVTNWDKVLKIPGLRVVETENVDVILETEMESTGSLLEYACMGLIL